MTIRKDLDQLDGKLSDGEVHLWHIDLTRHASAVEQLHSLLNTDEQQRAARFLVPAPRVQFIISRALLRTALGRYLQVEPREVRFRLGAQGKPAIAGTGDLEFNLSHTEGATVIAVTRSGIVGVDVERIRENLNPLEMAARFFSRKEVDWLRKRPETGRFADFFAIWTLKEAYIKACGGGLSIPLAGFGVIPGVGDARLNLEIYAEPEESGRWSMWQFELEPTLRSALAVKCTECGVRLGSWPES